MHFSTLFTAIPTVSAITIAPPPSPYIPSIVPRQAETTTLTTTITPVPDQPLDFVINLYANNTDCGTSSRPKLVFGVGCKDATLEVGGSLSVLAQTAVQGFTEAGCLGQVVPVYRVDGCVIPEVTIKSWRTL
ncbi:hypothetical protein K469DRAFT_710299 [Zopfia rhizophila CBS 207.26]|uniref:Uncharacterized protein n=1 Tax=Zopfia rhizophila CBS 207.26 TaxID=1314779 RepID=A0A6A6E1Z3_9PEZI|nr:hypothetical protein K469DRAFT_710299 [Zopfia rhizophila CBS 207.26]